MAQSLPPRRHPTPTKLFKPNVSPLHTLLQMGFPKHRAEKALAASGHRSVQLAADWLLAHVNDPDLDVPSPREYILYACPTGRFLEQLQTFWVSSLNACIWNGAHNYVPHITLVSFFKASDEHSAHLAQSLESIMDRQGAKLNEPLKLEVYSSSNFMGFFVVEEHADHLKRIAMQYVKEVSSAIVSESYEQFDAITACFPWCSTTTARCIPRGSRSISLEPHVKALHLTLAYQFRNTHYATLMRLLENVQVDASSEWELRLYSRESRIAGKQVHKVVQPYTALKSDEIDLHVGDCVYISEESTLGGGGAQDGWVEGTSWLTGTTGYLPESHIRRTAESDAWTLHSQCALFTEPSPARTSVATMSNGGGGGSAIGDFDVVDGAASCERLVGNNEQNVFIMRHGERVDFTFGSTWVAYSFDAAGNYMRTDLNMPSALFARSAGPDGYRNDTPLTSVGVFQANTVGLAFRDNGHTIEHVYCSPSLRAVQTCDAVLCGCSLKDTVRIRIEPALFEWMQWHKANSPDWLTTEELLAAKFNVDPDYRPIVDELSVRESNETLEEYYQRSALVVRTVLAAHPRGNVLLVGHAATLDACSRQLLGKGARPPAELMQLLPRIPYCSVMQLRRRTTTDDGSWSVAESCFPPMTHSINSRFDHTILMD